MVVVVAAVVAASHGYDAGTGGGLFNLAAARDIINNFSNTISTLRHMRVMDIISTATVAIKVRIPGHGGDDTYTITHSPALLGGSLSEYCVECSSCDSL